MAVRRTSDSVHPSLLIPAIFVVGIVLTLRRRLWARFWLGWTVLVGVIVVLVHFVPGPSTETMGVIYRSYVRSGVDAAAGVLALVVLAVILVGLAALIAYAVRAHRASGRW